MSLLRLPQALLGHRLGYSVETLSISLAMDNPHRVLGILPTDRVTRNSQQANFPSPRLPLDGPRGQAQATVTCITSAMGNVERSLARIRHTLRKHGIEEDEAEDHCNNSPRGIFPLLEIENIHLTLSSTDGKDMNPLRTQS
ncbi:hypothetical protein C8J57DRAFT_1229783 [Mycena rebaudengoi]|nr:hypothetical protein C8J57DRAFT_1229783 [Mycena rebaudengoi]